MPPGGGRGGSAPRTAVRPHWAPLCAIGLALALGGCSDRVLETGIGWDYLFGEPRDAPPSPVRRMAGDDETYPSLGSVPPRPPPPLSATEFAIQRDELSAEARAGNLARELLAEEAARSR